MTRRPFVWAALVAVLLVCPACSRRPDNVIVGIGLTSNAHPGVRLAVEEINAKGGIDGVPLRVVGLEGPGQESRFDPQAVIRWADRFAATEGLLGVIGHSDSATTLSAAAIYNKHGIPQIVTIATNPAITGIGEWTYRLCLSDAAQGPALADYVVRDWHKRRIALFYVNDDYGRGLAQRFEVRATALGGTIVTAVMHRNVMRPDDREMIARAVRELATSQPPPDVVVLFQRNDGAEFTISQLHAAGLKVDILGGDTLAQQAFLASGPESKEGMRVSQFFYLAPDNPRAQQFARSFDALTHAQPDYSQAFAYDAVYLLCDAIRAGNFSRAGVKRYLDQLIADRTVVTGVGGQFRLGTDHDARRPLYIAEAHEGVFRVLQPLRVE